MEKLKVFLTIFIIFLFLGLVLQEYSNKEKLILVSVDALEWKVINRLIDEGKLPNLKRFIEEGSYGSLKSPYSYSPISWTNILTGKTKEKHGILDFGINNIPMRSYDVKTKRVWDYLNDDGIGIGVYKHYFTWPVEKVNGFMIADHLSSEWYTLNRSYYPESLGETVNKTSNDIKNSLISKDCWAIFYLFKEFKPEFYTFFDNEIHIVTHSYWKYFNPEKFNVANEDEISDGYSKIIWAYSVLDDCIGQIDENAKGYDIIIVSDHGMGDKINISYYVDFSQMFSDTGITNIVLEYPYIDEAYGKNQGDIEYFVNFTVLDPEKSKEDIRKTFEKIHYSDGTIFFENISFDSGSMTAFMDWNRVKKNFVRNTTMSNLFLDYYILLTIDDRNVTTAVRFREKSGEHYPDTDGVFIAKGPHIKKNFRITNISVYDVTPTILYLYNINVPEDMDGRVLKDIIKSETGSLLSFLRTSFLNFLHSESEEEKKEYVNVSGGNEKLFELLRSLGYSV